MTRSEINIFQVRFQSLINLCWVFGNSPSFNVPTNSLNSNRLKPYVHLNETIIPHLEFSIEFQSNQLIYQKEYTKRQQIIYLLIHHLHHILVHLLDLEDRLQDPQGWWKVCHQQLVELEIDYHIFFLSNRWYHCIQLYQVYIIG